MSFCSHSTLNAIRTEVRTEEAALEVLSLMVAQFPATSVAGDALLTALMTIEDYLVEQQKQAERQLTTRSSSNSDGGGFDVFTDK